MKYISLYCDIEGDLSMSYDPVLFRGQRLVKGYAAVRPSS